MGFAISWMAVSGKPPQQVLDELGLSRTQETEEFPESELACTVLPSGWFLVCAQDFASPLTSAAALGPLSASCEVIACHVEEHVMFSSATAYADGAERWRIEHDAQQAMYHLAVAGAVPAGFDGIHAQLKRQQDEEGGEAADVDYLFDVPLTLAASIVGYRHDQDVEGAASRFEVLRQERAAPGPASRPWWKIW